MPERSSKTAHCCGVIISNFPIILGIAILLFFYLSNCDGSSNDGFKGLFCQFIDQTFAGIDGIFPIRTVVLFVFFIFTLAYFFWRVSVWKRHAAALNEEYRKVYSDLTEKSALEAQNAILRAENSKTKAEMASLAKSVENIALIMSRSNENLSLGGPVNQVRAIHQKPYHSDGAALDTKNQGAGRKALPPVPKKPVYGQNRF